MMNNPIAVFAGHFWQGASASGIADGLLKQGWKVQQVNIGDYCRQKNPSILSRINQRLFSKKMVAAYHRQILNECEILKPDIFITVKGSEITKELLIKIKKIGVKAVMYYPDYHFEHKDVNTSSFEFYDYFITTKTFHNEYLRNFLEEKDIYYAPHGFSESVHSLVHNNSQSFYFEQDVGYIGNHSKYKQDFLMQLVERNQDINLRICGANWHANIEGTLLEEKYDPTPRSGLSYSSFIQKSKINIALHFGEGPNGWADQVSTRTFEIPACGGFMLHVDNDEVRDFYSVGDEIDVFTNPEQLCERIGFYLENEKTRIEMSMSAHRRANGAYSYSEIAGRINDFIFKKPVER